MQSMDDVYQQYAGLVYRYLLSVSGNPSIAEELTQETFFQAIRTIDRYDETCRLSTWLIGIAKNAYRSYLRKNPVHAPLDEVPEEAQKAASPEESVLSAEQKLETFAKLHALPDPYREILYLRVFGDLSFRDIGAILGKNENWARVMYFRGKELLKKEFENGSTEL